MSRGTRVRRLAAFVAVGGTSALIDAGVFAALHLWGVTAWLASGISFCSAFAVNYLGNRNLVFRHTGAHRAALLRYVALVLVNLAVSSAGVAFLTGPSGLSPWLAKAVCMVAVAAGNFVVLRYWVFSGIDRGGRPGIVPAGRVPGGDEPV